MSSNTRISAFSLASVLLIASATPLLAASSEADFKAAGATGPDGPRMAPRLIHAFKDSLRVLEESLARRGELDASAGPHQQPRAELAFQIPDLLAQGRLRYVQPLGRAREAGFLGDGDEIAQMA